MEIEDLEKVGWMRCRTFRQKVTGLMSGEKLEEVGRLEDGDALVCSEA